VFEGPAFIAADGVTKLDDAALHAGIERFLSERLHASELHPDGWLPVIVHDPKTTKEVLARAAGDKYSYRQLEDFTELIARTLQTLPIVSKVQRTGIRGERVFLEYSQARLAAYGLKPGSLSSLLGARNITASGGVL